MLLVATQHVIEILCLLKIELVVSFIWSKKGKKRKKKSELVESVNISRKF